jgi:DNA/RNA-binding domain of Phe-tRNA-synthetase-like protein
MNVRINQDVFTKLPKFNVAIIKVRGFDNAAGLAEAKHLLAEVVRLARLQFQKDTAKNHNLIAPWVVAQEEFGKSAKHYHTSVERLLKKVLSKKSIEVNDTLTNLVRYISLKYIVPVGVDDANKINGQMTFGVARGNERIGHLRKLKKGALYYRDEKKVLGTKFDFWKSSATKLNKNSSKVIIHVEALPPFGVQKTNGLVKEFVKLLKAFGARKVSVGWLDSKRNSIRV